jgi:hypothetical protein
MYGLQDNSLALIHELYDFTRCERPNGSVYGTGGKCRKGTEIGDEELDRLIKSVRLSPQQEAVGDQLVKNAVETFGLDKQKTAEFYKEVKAEKEKVLKEMDEKLITRGEVDNFVKEHPGKGNFLTAKVITVGMEETLPKDPTPKEIDEGMAVRFAQERIRRKLGLDHMPKELVVAGEIQTPGEPLYKLARGETKNVPGARFWTEQASLLTKAGAKDVEDGASYKLYSSKLHAGLELGAIPAASTGAWPVGDRPWVKDVSSVSQALGSRRGAAQLYNRDRVRALMGQVDKAIANNPNLTTIALAPGKKGSELTNLMFSHLQSKGAQIFEKEAQAMAGTKAVMRVAVIQGAKGKLVTIVDPGISVSTQVTREFKQGVGAFVARAKSGAIQPTGFHRQTTTKERPVSTREARPKALPKPEVKPMRVNNPIVAGQQLLRGLREKGKKDADIRRDFPMLNKIWGQIQ